MFKLCRFSMETKGKTEAVPVFSRVLYDCTKLRTNDWILM